MPDRVDPLERGGMPATRKRYRLRHPERDAAQKLAWKRANPEKNRASSRKTHLKKNFGMTIEDYDAMLAEQGGVCAICERPPFDGKRLAVDHDHQTGAVRGLLHVSCNASLGVLEPYIERAVAYLGARAGSD